MYRSIPNFISAAESKSIQEHAPSPRNDVIANDHIRAVAEATNGWTVLSDLTKTEVSKEVSKFQGDATSIDEVHPIFLEIADRIAKTLAISSEHVFFQYIQLGKNGIVRKHYDAGKPGYITYKCNVCVSGPEQDAIWVGKEAMPVTPYDLYAFEANLYKHWMDTSEQARVHLSYGFLIPYAELGWEENSPRISLSNRIWEAYIGRRVK